MVTVNGHSVRSWNLLGDGPLSMPVKDYLDYIHCDMGRPKVGGTVPLMEENGDAGLYEMEKESWAPEHITLL